MGLNPLFHYEAFGANIITREIVHVEHHWFFYTTSMDYFPEMVCDFYDWMVVDEETRVVRIIYGNNIYTISIKVIAKIIVINLGTQESKIKAWRLGRRDSTRGKFKMGV